MLSVLVETTLRLQTDNCDLWAISGALANRKIPTSLGAFLAKQSRLVFSI